MMHISQSLLFLSSLLLATTKAEEFPRKGSVAYDNSFVPKKPPKNDVWVKNGICDIYRTPGQPDMKLGRLSYSDAHQKREILRTQVSKDDHDAFYCYGLECKRADAMARVP